MPVRRSAPGAGPITVKPRVYRGRNLAEIAFPLGGLGCGNVSIGGYGQLRDWELFNRPGKGLNLQDSFFAVWAKTEGREPVAAVLEAEAPSPFTGSYGFRGRVAPGLPRLGSASFASTYPFARVKLEDAGLPVTASVEAFTPFVPLRDIESGLPAAVFLWTIANRGRRRVSASVAFSLLNPIGLDGTEGWVGARNAAFGGNRNELVQDRHNWAIHMTSERYPAGDVRHGSLAAGVLWPRVSAVTRWPVQPGWGLWDLMEIWREFAATGRVRGPSEPSVSPDGTTERGTLCALLELEPGEALTVPFVLAWSFPNRRNDWNTEAEVRGKIIKNYYTTWFPDAPAVLSHVVREFDRLQGESRAFERAFWGSSLPWDVLESAGNQLATLRSNSCWRDQEGRFFGFEGCGGGYDGGGDRVGCCPLNCTHVWNYAQTVAFLFPELERTMRTTDFMCNTRPGGDMAFRTLAPVEAGALWNHSPAADGQMGTIMRLYREWQISGDMEFLRSLWPKAKEALEYAWKGWDADRDGVMEGEQHNTFDIEFYGPNPLTTVLYLGALRAGEEMALAVGEQDAASEYRKVFDAGSRKAAELLWNGEYFVQPDVPAAGAAAGPGGPAVRVHQHGDGCLTDQLLGQWMAHLTGLGYLLPEAKVKKAVMAIYRHNFRRSLRGLVNTGRVYAHQDDGGVLECTWPRGARPKAPFPYADEVWTGSEYQLAAHLILEGLVREGLEVVSAVRRRHDGDRRNPFNEPECGNHYVRGLSSWSVLLALSGFRWSAPEQTLRFVPALPGARFSAFFSNGAAWGTATQGRSRRRGLVTFAVAGGALAVRRLRLDPGFTKLERAWIEPGMTFLRGSLERRKGEALVEFADRVEVQGGQALVLSFGR